MVTRKHRSVHHLASGTQQVLVRELLQHLVRLMTSTSKSHYKDNPSNKRHTYTRRSDEYLKLIIISLGKNRNGITYNCSEIHPL